MLRPFQAVNTLHSNCYNYQFFNYQFLIKLPLYLLIINFLIFLFVFFFITIFTRFSVYSIFTPSQVFLGSCTMCTVPSLQLITCMINQV